MYRAYCWTHDGKQIPGYTEIEETPQAIMNYFQVQSTINPTVVITDENDMTVAKMENGKLVFPETEQEINFLKK